MWNYEDIHEASAKYSNHDKQEAVIFLKHYHNFVTKLSLYALAMAVFGKTEKIELPFLL